MFVVLKPGCRDKIGPRELIEFACKHLAPYKVPRGEVETRGELQRVL